MRIDCIVLPIQLETAYQFVYTQVGHWSDYSVRVMKDIWPYFQNPWLTSAALIGFNIICFEVATSICHVIYKIFYQQSQENLAIHESDERILSLTMMFVVAMGMANWAFCHRAPPSLSNWKTVALSIMTVISYLAWKTC